jgi:fermentation-respiration switch protein FrsA (DUF1100 family)
MIGWVIGAAAACAAAGGGAWLLGAKTQQPRRRPIEEVPQVPYETVRFESGGVPMAGWLIRPKADGPLPAVVVAHGWGSNRSRVLRYAHPLVEAGYAVFLYDARSHGESGAVKAPTGFMFAGDVEAAVAAAARLPGIDASRMAVLGHSLGGFGAVLAYSQGLPVRAVITDAAPLRFETMLLAELKRRKLPRFPLDRIIPRIWLYRAGIPYEDALRVDVPGWIAANAAAAREGRGKPLLMIHSTGDPLIPADELRSVASAAPVEHLFVDAPGHSCSEQDPAFWPTVLPFLRKHLA